MLTNIDTPKLDVFISGELIDLCIPDAKFALESDWYMWFNDKRITKYLDQGLFPNTRESQKKFFDEAGADRLILIVVDKKGLAIGVTSLSKINLMKQTCDIALVMSDCGDKDVRPQDRMKPFASLEATALISDHAIKNLGMRRVTAGQHIALKGWQKRLELFGYKLEGMHIKQFKKGVSLADSMTICLSQDDFLELSKTRGGSLWDNLETMKLRIKNQPRESYCDKLIKFYEEVRADYYKDVFAL